MTSWGVTMARDEADVIAGTLRHMADEVDGLVVADNRSTDDTRKIIDALDLPVPLIVIDDDEPAYYQSQKMTALARIAAQQGATWIVPFDADELWFTPAGRIADVLEGSVAAVVEAKLFNHFPTAVDPDEVDPFDRIVWRQPEPAALPKVAFRWHPDAVICQGNHDVWLSTRALRAQALEIRHFPYRSAEQFVRKARNGAEAYRAADLPDEIGAHWRSYGDLLDRFGADALLEVFRTHFWFLSPTDAGLTPDQAPYLRWQRRYPWQLARQ
jgi:hypothetical protein